MTDLLCSAYRQWAKRSSKGDGIVAAADLISSAHDVTKGNVWIN